MATGEYRTPEYLSPERCTSILHDERLSDIWSLGITFYEIVIGRTPFESSTTEEFLTREALKIYYRRTLSSGHFRGSYSLSLALEDLVKRMVEPNTEKRMRSCKEGMEHPFFLLRPAMMQSCNTVSKEGGMVILCFRSFTLLILISYLRLLHSSAHSSTPFSNLTNRILTPPNPIPSIYRGDPQKPSTNTSYSSSLIPVPSNASTPVVVISTATQRSKKDGSTGKNIKKGNKSNMARGNRGVVQIYKDMDSRPSPSPSPTPSPSPSAGENPDDGVSVKPTSVNASLRSRTPSPCTTSAPSNKDASEKLKKKAATAGLKPLLLRPDTNALHPLSHTNNNTSNRRNANVDTSTVVLGTASPSKIFGNNKDNTSTSAVKSGTFISKKSPITPRKPTLKAKDSLELTSPESIQTIRGVSTSPNGGGRSRGKPYLGRA